MENRKSLDREPTWLERESVRPLKEIKELTSLSPDTLKRRYAEYVVELSPGRLGMKLKHGLAIANGEIK